MEILSFTVNHQEEKYEAAVGENLVLSWECSGCEGCVLYPYNWEVKEKGSLTVSVYRPTIFLLRAYNELTSVQKEITVTMGAQEQLHKISVSPKGETEAGEETQFLFDISHTNYGYLDHGIGRVEGDSYRRVLRENYSIYRYRILSNGRNGIDYQEQGVKAGRGDALALDRLRYTLARRQNTREYTVDWRVENHEGAEVLLKVSDQKTELSKDPGGCITFKRPDSGAVCTLSVHCRREDGEEISFESIYPFEAKG